MNFRDADFIVEEKLDGVRAVVSVIKCKAIVTGRRWRMPGVLETLSRDGGLSALPYHEALDGCCFDGELLGDAFHVFDLPVVGGEDIRRRPLAARKRRLAALTEFLPAPFRVVRSFATVAALGDFREGIVWKDARSRYGHGWYKSKRVVTVDVRITRILDIGVAETDGRGKIVGVPENVVAGQMVEVEAFAQFASGKLRNGRFVRTRDDK